MDKILKTILNLAVLSTTKFPVGLQSYVEDLIRTIKNKSTEVCTIVICGQGGSGKTTLAKAIYHQIHSTFTEKSFIEDIGQLSGIRGDLLLQEQLLSRVLKTKVKIRSIEMGRSMIRERLSGKRVLIVLDDVPEFDDASLVWECRHWLSGGSVIIITTRDEDLPSIHQVDTVFRMNLMNAEESLELFSWHAFREAKPKEEYRDLAERVVAGCGGLPLALEVIGTCLGESKNANAERNRLVLTLYNIPQPEVSHILKISIDGLPSQMVKDLFLDVCCFFVGKGRAYVTKILNGCGVAADSGIRVLIERNLIKVKKNNKLGMHPLIQQMGRDIHESSSSAWFSKFVLTNNTVRIHFV